MVATLSYYGYEHILQPTECTLWLLAATSGRSQGEETQRCPVKSLDGPVEVATKYVQVLTPWLADTLVMGSSAQEHLHQPASVGKRGSGCQHGCWDGKSASTIPHKANRLTPTTQPSLICWVAGTQNENKRNTTKSNSTKSQGKIISPHPLRKLSSPPPFLSSSTIVAALMQIIREQEDQRSSENQFSPVFIFLSTQKTSPGFHQSEPKISFCLTPSFCQFMLAWAEVC